MIIVRECPECLGKGTYKIYNAYDPEFVEEIVCEFCDGAGTQEEVFIPPRRQSRPLDDWVN